ncbi:uncharacterized protein F5147DRAFT_658137 [Suillus discolor]|uniref:Uncharacterized protein n=1 Tax=Suillus discolor TaxID=1912936 RepID=A0A9P7ETZ0_9AGAM|nr:uncharacterized protein F5147DRAFT_658137 [Suillus discolor]KAG2090623.1 hypothetical protein F5147DRAFT_658137 [Suillus discolor]
MSSYLAGGTAGLNRETLRSSSRRACALLCLVLLVMLRHLESLAHANYHSRSSPRLKLRDFSTPPGATRRPECRGDANRTYTEISYRNTFSSIWFVPESPQWLVKFDAHFAMEVLREPSLKILLVYNFWLYFEAVFCHFFIVETRNCTLEVATPIMTARFNSPTSSSAFSTKGMAHSHDAVAHAGLAPKN